MADYFTHEHFKLLNEWKGKKRDKANPDQNHAYEELKNAYEVTKAWADELQTRLFPTGYVDVRKRPTSRANTFFPYNWARIYPSKDSPKALAYTVGIGHDDGFVVKIDTVHINDGDSVRGEYLSLRGNYDNTSPFVAVLSASDGLEKTFAELVDWSVDSVRKFSIDYDELANKLQLEKPQGDEALLQHFDGKPSFKTFRASWTSQESAAFCKLARTVHELGLDWWHMASGIEVRFGRKNPDSERAVGVIGTIRGSRTRTITLRREIGELAKLHREPFADELIETIVGALSAEPENLEDLLVTETGREGLWPDQLRDDPAESGVDSDGNLDSAQADSQALNRIYYGPPGTGKTYQVSRLIEREYVQKMSLVSEDEWQSQFISENIASLTWWESAAAALYDLGGSARVDALLSHAFMQAVAAAKSANKNVRNTIWGALQYHTVETSEVVKMSKRMAPAVFDKTADSVWSFAGEWEESCADIIEMVKAYRAGPPAAGSVHRYSFVTFHQSYGYEEFVEGLRPLLDDDTESGAIRYEIRTGVFKELCRKARLAPAQRFAMVIDEINRGNISKIFGELITLIEPDKREGAENEISVILPYSGHHFSIPPNVDIIGTMNTADRSLALLDTALRRRFEFVPVLPDTRDEEGAPLFGLCVSMDEKTIDVPRLLSAINQRVEALYDREHCIGHAYFTSLAKVPDGEERMVELSRVFRNRILPLLEEYFFEDWQKIQLVLADNQKPEAVQFVIEQQEHEQDLNRLFGSDHGLDTYTTKQRYMIQDSSFANPDAYIGIYQTLPSR
ncbi:McrB family protein [Granulosicoccus antarcticus]|uniref:5-methylcytosine-specific restriction enzyme B n=1 Tax=Granulosicoccus antarcticus IMCC3135 TaxID=1192854 RepID=A0A2Z2NS30_9GAMM|nr:AAA family ATPase [Granulosicoccus antarcticus]ASJ72811.1 5-methylcytosine-specific restriction enzyme B [Granulosicoccus antarcticus IMCC3135]